jgi:hypothetical protein
MTVVNGAALMGGKTLTGATTYTVVIDPDTALEEIVDVTVYASGNTLTITRGIDSPSPGTGSAHSAGAVVRHMAIGRDYQEANDHIENVTTAHGVTGAVVGTTNTQVLTNKDLTSATNTLSTSVVTLTGSQTLTNKTLTSPTITGTGAIAGTFTGNLTGNVTGNVTGSSGSTTGNAATATALATGRTFQLTGDVEASGVTFDGTGNVSLTTVIGTGAIVNADINASAAIDKTKISGTAITAADTGTVTSTMITDGTIVNGDINSSAQIAYSKTNLTNSIINADVNASAAIDWSKIAPSSTVSTTELGYLDGVTSAIQTQLDSKLATATASSTYAPLANPTLTGVPTAPTAAANTNTTQIATTAYVQTEITDLIGGAPGALDTLNELATALANDASYSTTITTALATKLPLAGGTMTGAIAMGTNKITGLGDPTTAQDAATKNYIDTVVLAPSNLTGPITSVGNVTSIASQTGTGTKFVVDTSPTLVTPVLGVATATSVNGTTIPTSKTLVATDSTQYVVPSQTGNSGKYLTTDGTNSSWGTVTSYSAPTIGSTSIASGATVTTIAGLTLTSPIINTATENSPILVAPEERTTVSATAAATTVNFDAVTQGVLYYTSNATANWTLNVRGSSGATLNSILATGDSITVAFLVTNGSTAYRQTAFTIDGSAVTPKYSGGTAPAAGNASSIDVYTYTIIKTGSAAYTVFGAGPIKYA